MTHVIPVSNVPARPHSRFATTQPWASLSLEAPLTFLHVLDQRQYPVQRYLSGNMGLAAREHLTR